MTELQVRNYASEELAAWFDEYARYTRDCVKRARLEGRSIRPDCTHEDCLRCSSPPLGERRHDGLQVLG